MTELLVEASGLHAYYGSHHILHGVTFSVRPGEAIGLMGRNGMGKTTLLKTILGLVRAKEGRVAVNGHDTTHAASHRIARMGLAYVPEGRGIFPNLTVRENLVMAARPAPDGKSTWTLERLLAIFPRLAQRLAHPGGALSGGEQQILALGRALIARPWLLLLDEPSEGIQPSIVQEIADVLGRIKQEGKRSILLVEQYLDFARSICDRFYVMEKGAIALEGDRQSFHVDEVSAYLSV